MRIQFAIESDVIAGRLISEASRLNCDPHQLGVALVSVVLDAMLVDNVLDGDDPRRFARSRSRTPLEDRIDAVMLFVSDAIHAEADGRVPLGVRDIARGLGTKHGPIIRALKLLVDSGRLIAERNGHRQKTVYSLPSREAH